MTSPWRCSENAPAARWRRTGTKTTARWSASRVAGVWFSAAGAGTGLGRAGRATPGRLDAARYRPSEIGGVSSISGQATGRCIPAARLTRAASSSATTGHASRTSAGDIAARTPTSPRSNSLARRRNDAPPSNRGTDKAPSKPPVATASAWTPPHRRLHSECLPGSLGLSDSPPPGATDFRPDRVGASTDAAPMGRASLEWAGLPTGR